MTNNQPIDIGRLIEEISKASDNAQTTVQKMNAAVDTEELSRDLIIQTYKETTRSHLSIIKRLQDAYREFSKREVEEIRDRASRQEQAEHRDDGAAESSATEFQTLQTDNSKLSSITTMLEKEIADLKGEKAQLRTDNEALKGDNTRLEGEVASLKEQFEGERKRYNEVEATKELQKTTDEMPKVRAQQINV
jgi:chromosome segregation ATPase